MFENRYTITKKLYVHWAMHPVMLGGQTRRRGTLLTLIVLAVGVVMLVPTVINQDWKYAGLYTLLLAAVLFRMVGYEAVLAGMQYNKLRAGKDGNWDRVVYFEDGQIRIRDEGKLLAVKEYGRVEEVRTMKDGIALVLEGGIIIRLDRDGFFLNDQPAGFEAFVAFMREKCPEALFKS
jgi:hypothetical protein